MRPIGKCNNSDIVINSGSEQNGAESSRRHWGAIWSATSSIKTYIHRQKSSKFSIITEAALGGNRRQASSSYPIGGLPFNSCELPPTYLFDCGSSASRSPSPTKAKEIMISAISRLGMMTKTGRYVTIGKLWNTMLPQLAVGGRMPIPRKLRLASARI